jgi:hypothetical protein
MKPMVKQKTATIVTGIVLELTNDEATHLSRALHEGLEHCERCAPRQKWPWLSEFIKILDEQRGEGHLQGRRKC